MIWVPFTPRLGRSSNARGRELPANELEIAKTNRSARSGKLRVVVSHMVHIHHQFVSDSGPARKRAALIDTINARECAPPPIYSRASAASL